MPQQEKLSSALQESIVTAIALINDENSVIIANAVKVEFFDPPLDDIVARCLEYRKEFKRAPGKQHIDDVFAYVLEDEDHKSHSTYNRIINGMVRQSDGLDTTFIKTKTTDFVFQRLVRHSIVETVDKYQKGGIGFVEEIEDIWRKGLRIRKNADKDYGFTLGEDRALGFLDRDTNDFCKIAIPELDEHGIHPTRQELFLFVAARNRGKSQFLHHCGKYGLLKGWNVAHYTLENSDDMTAQRYFQSLFSGVKREGDYHYTQFFEEDNGTALRVRKLLPDFIIEHKEKTREFLKREMKNFPKLENLRIRRFPTGQLSFNALQRDLDELAIVHKFVPDLLLIDYPQMMKMDRRKSDWSALVELTIDLRGLFVERNIAGVVPQQGNRGAESATEVRGFHGGGSIEMLAIADNAVTYSQTDAEERHGLARLYAQKVRNDAARFTVCITQHYASGQFCMDSRFLDKNLRAEIKRFSGLSDSEEAEGEEDFEEAKSYKRKKKVD